MSLTMNDIPKNCSSDVYSFPMGDGTSKNFHVLTIHKNMWFKLKDILNALPLIPTGCNIDHYVKPENRTTIKELFQDFNISNNFFWRNICSHVIYVDIIGFMSLMTSSKADYAQDIIRWIIFSVIKYNPDKFEA